MSSSFWDERYAQPFAAFGITPNDFLVSQEARILQACEVSGGKRVLCLGDGEGRNAIWLAQLGLKVTMVDLSPVGLRNAQDRAASLGLPLSVLQADLTQFDMGTSAWDAMISIFCHLPREIRRPVYRKVVEGLKPRAVFVLESYTPAQIGRGTGGPSDVDMLSTAELLRQELSGLEFGLLREVNRDVREGVRHGGMSSVVQMVATKP